MRSASPLLAAFAAGGLAVMAAQCPSTKSEDTRVPDHVTAEGLPEVLVPLLDPPRQVRGMDLPGGLHTEAVGSADLLEPHRLTVRLPDDRTVSLIARSMSFICRHGIVESVYVRRPMQPVRFGEAVADLRHTMEELGIEPRKQMLDTMATWPDDAPGFGEGGIPYNFGTRTPAYDQVDLGVKVKPDPRGGWYYLMSFGATHEARVAAQAAGRLAALPAESPYEVRPRDRGEAEPAMEGGGLLPEVSVPLLGSFRDVEAIELRSTLPEIRLTARDLLQPHRLTLRLPDGRSAALDVRAMTFLCHYGVIEDVYLRRPMQPVPFEQAVADLRQTIEALGVDPDQRLREQMERWPEDAPEAGQGAEPHTFEAKTAVSETVDLRVRLGTDPEGDGWYSLILFSATDEAKQAAQAAAGTPDASPADEPQP